MLERTLIRLRRRRGAAGGQEREPGEHLTPTAFRAVVDERLRSLERQLDEAKGRVNGLLFLLAGTVVAQLLLQLMG